jgi:CBS domain-containing protein/ribosome-associated translation inhibitor RaiA
MLTPRFSHGDLMGVKDLQDLKKISILRSQIDGKKIDEILETEFPTVGPEDSIGHALALMRETGYQDVPVVENGNYLGMISYGTVLKKRSIKIDSKVKNHMRNLHVIADGTDITELAETMVVNNYRQLPVLNKHRKIVGMLSRSGLIEIAEEIKAFTEIKVWEIMTSPVETVNRRDLLETAVEIMRGLDIRTVPVVDDRNGVVGIVGMKEIIGYNWSKMERETVGDLSGENEHSDVVVESVCATAVVTADWNDSLGSAVRMMIGSNISTLPVIEDGCLVGIITQYDIIELISACRERDMLFIEISGLDENDKLRVDSLYDRIKEEVARISRMTKPQSLIIHVAKYHESDGRNKYSLSARMVLDRRVINAKNVDWELLKAADDLMKKISREVVEMKETKISLRKKKGAN